MMISDGVLPSNEGRGYVLRRLIRRSLRHGKLLGIQGKFLTDIANVAIDQSKFAYPDLESNRQTILRVLGTEEDRFAKTIDQGMELLEEFMEKAKEAGIRVVDGKTAFRLHDTFGFPIDLTKDIAEEKGFTVDEEGFAQEMEKQKQMAREALKSDESQAWDLDVFDLINDAEPTEFLAMTKKNAKARSCIYPTEKNWLTAPKREKKSPWSWIVPYSTPKAADKKETPGRYKTASWRWK